MMRARDNPFATERVLRLRYQFEAPDAWPSLLSTLESFHYRAALIGPHGSGKTTLLEDLGSRLQEQGFQTHLLFLNEQNRDYPAKFVNGLRHRLTANDVILFDGCEQLGPLNWQRFRWHTRRAGGLIITTHLAGRLPVLWQCKTDPDLLGDLVQQLTGPALSIEPEEIRRLHAAFNGNLREALRHLYDRAQSGTLSQLETSHCAGFDNRASLSPT